MHAVMTLNYVSLVKNNIQTTVERAFEAWRKLPNPNRHLMLKVTSTAYTYPILVHADNHSNTGAYIIIHHENPSSTSQSQLANTFSYFLAVMLVHAFYNVSNNYQGKPEELLDTTLATFDVQVTFGNANGAAYIHVQNGEVVFTQSSNEQKDEELWNVVNMFYDCIKEGYEHLRRYYEMPINNEQYFGGQRKPRKGSYESMTVKELKERCVKRRIKHSGLTKDQLISALRSKKT